MPKGTHPFVYLSLEIEPKNVDVNVHPTKHEVHFLHQDDIIESIQQAVDAKLLGSNASRTFYTQALLPGASVPLDIQNLDVPSCDKEKSKAPAVAPKNLVRTDAKEQKLDKFMSFNEPRKSLDSSRAMEKSFECDPVPSTSKATVQNPEPMDTFDQGACEASRPSLRREIKLASLKRLRENVEKENHKGLRDLIANHSFVGCISKQFALLQHSTQLYVVNTSKLSYHLFKQLALHVRPIVTLLKN